MYILNNVGVVDGVGDGGGGGEYENRSHCNNNKHGYEIQLLYYKIYVDGYQFLVQAILVYVLKHKDHIASFVSCSIIALLNRVKRPCLVIGNNI